jgi:hypothetical protein
MSLYFGALTLAVAIASAQQAGATIKPAETRTRPKPPPIDLYNHQSSDGSKPPEYWRKRNVPKKLRKKP